MSFIASRGNIIINIIILIVLLRLIAGIFGHTSSSSRTSQSTHNATEMEKKESRFWPHMTKTVDLNDLYSAAVEGGDIKAWFACVMIGAGIVVYVLSSVFFIIQAFCVDVFWGVCVLLFNGIAILFFTIFHWNRAKYPLLAYLASCILLVVGAVLA